MKINERKTIEKLDEEFATVADKFRPLHSVQRQMRDYSLGSSYYPKKGGDDVPDDRKIRTNYLKRFANMNAAYLSPYPTIKVPPPGPDDESRALARNLEQAVYAIHEENRVPFKQRDWARDGTIMGEFFGHTKFNIHSRRVEIHRFAPDYCYYDFANDNDDTIRAFWVAIPMGKEQIQKQYGVTPNSSNIPAFSDEPMKLEADGNERFYVIWRWDEKQYCCWAGDQWIVQPHDHEYGFIPFDRCVLFPTGDRSENNGVGFFLTELIDLQAELNDALYRLSRYVRRMAKPVLWGRQIFGKDWDDVKDAMGDEFGGAVGLKQGGELGYTQVQDLKLLTDYIRDTLQRMRDQTGFSDASFGEVLGANTSADAVGMYYQPTVQAVREQWIGIKDFYESMNAKALSLLETFGTTEDNFQYSGMMPKGTFTHIIEGEGKDRTERYGKSYSAKLDPYEMRGYTKTVVTPPSALPKNELEEQRFALDAADRKLLPLVEMFERMGVPDPEQAVQQLLLDRENPSLDPDTYMKVAQAEMYQMQAETGQTPGGTPATGNPTGPEPPVDSGA